jgi:hypothetical protein
MALLAIYLPFALAFAMLWRGIGVHARQVLSTLSALPALWMAMGPGGLTALRWNGFSSEPNSVSIR